MADITFVSPYRDLSLEARAIADEMKLDLDIVEGIMTEDGWLGGNDPFRSGKPQDTILVSRGGTAYHLAKSHGLPVVTLNPGPLDLLESCMEARKYGNNIIVTSFQPIQGLELIADALGITITFLSIDKLSGLESRIASLAGETGICLVGGGPTMTFAERAGLPHVFFKTSPESVREALLRARELSALHHEANRRARRLETILGCVHEGIVAVDAGGRIDQFNREAERILGIDAWMVMGKAARDSLQGSKLQAVLKSGVDEFNQVDTINGRRVVTSRVAVRDGKRIMGVVATFQAETVIRQAEMRLRRETSDNRFKARFTFPDIAGESPVILRKVELARKFAVSDLTVFINGASGTGKEMFAQSIHNASPRVSGPFVAVNCGALPESLLESELFGYAEGAFTGAKRNGKPGLFELAHHGTIFLDEIDAMPLDMQGRLLRVLQEREVLRIGAEGLIPVDIRVIAASNKPPATLLGQRLIREDLYYRLNVLYLEIPPLRERPGDVSLLFRRFCAMCGGMDPEPLLGALGPRLERYGWPGNVRELMNFAQRLSFMASEGSDAGIDDMLAMLAPELSGRQVPAGAPPGGDAADPERDDTLKACVDSREEEIILEALRRCNGLSEAAAELGISRTTLWRKVKKIQEKA